MGRGAGDAAADADGVEQVRWLERRRGAGGQRAERERQRQRENARREQLRGRVVEKRAAQPPPPALTDEKLNAEEEDEFTPTRTIFNNALDSVKAISEAGEPIKLINRAIKNLEIIDPKHRTLKSSESRERIDLLYAILKKIMKN